MAEPRITRPRNEIVDALVKQLSSLARNSADYDNGREDAFIEISLSLRILFYNHRQSKSLLNQLGLENIQMFSSGYPYDQNNGVPFLKLVGYGGSVYERGFVPLLDDSPGEFISFPEWWNETIIKATDIESTRSKLILDIANTDGGAHYDPDVPEQYYNLSRKNGAGWFIEREDGSEPPAANPVPTIMRQMAFEVLKSFDNVDFSSLYD